MTDLTITIPESMQAEFIALQKEKAAALTARDTEDALWVEAKIMHADTQKAVTKRLSNVNRKIGGLFARAQSQPTAPTPEPAPD